MLLRSHSPKRPSLICSGYQLISRVTGDEALLSGRGADVPGGLGVIEEGGVAAPAEGVGVAVHLASVEEPPGLQILHDGLVGIFHELAGTGVLPLDDALEVHGLEEVEASVTTDVQVLVTEGRGDVDDAGAVFQAHKLLGDDMAGKALHRLQAGDGTPPRAVAPV